MNDPVSKKAIRKYARIMLEGGDSPAHLSSVDVIFVRGNGRMVDHFETERVILEIQSIDIHCRTCPHIP